MGILPHHGGDRLMELENSIEQSKRQFYVKGNALIEIRDSQLYLQFYSSFEVYCKFRWKMTRRRVNQLIESVKVADNVQNLIRHRENQWFPLPTNERQLRPLTRLNPLQQQEAWAEAVRTNSSGKITSNYVEETVKKMYFPHELGQENENQYHPAIGDRVQIILREGARERYGGLSVIPVQNFNNQLGTIKDVNEFGVVVRVKQTKTPPIFFDEVVPAPPKVVVDADLQYQCEEAGFTSIEDAVKYAIATSSKTFAG